VGTIVLDRQRKVSCEWTLCLSWVQKRTSLTPTAGMRIDIESIVAAVNRNHGQSGPRARLYWPIVLTTLDSGRVLLVEEYLSCALTMSSYFASVVTGSFGTMCTIL
jgi:hypothetical protein